LGRGLNLISFLLLTIRPDQVETYTGWGVTISYSAFHVAVVPQPKPVILSDSLTALIRVVPPAVLVTSSMMLAWKRCSWGQTGILRGWRRDSAFRSRLDRQAANAWDERQYGDFTAQRFGCSAAGETCDGRFLHVTLTLPASVAWVPGTKLARGASAVDTDFQLCTVSFFLQRTVLWLAAAELTPITAINAVAATVRPRIFKYFIVPP
jgi:hypothetical protein